MVWKSGQTERANRKVMSWIILWITLLFAMAATSFLAPLWVCSDLTFRSESAVSTTVTVSGPLSADQRAYAIFQQYSSQQNRLYQITKGKNLRGFSNRRKLHSRPSRPIQRGGVLTAPATYSMQAPQVNTIGASIRCR